MLPYRIFIAQTKWLRCGRNWVGFSVRESAAAVDVPTKTPRYVAELTVGGGSVSWLHPATAAAVNKAMA